MNTPSSSHAETLPDDPARSSSSRKVLVWDAPVRVFHWLMVFSFAGAYLTAESERLRLVHVTLGYTMAGLVAFRLVWGFVGTRHARFASFVRGPGAVMRYLRALPNRQAEPTAGHNPAGALAIMALLAMTAVVCAAGWATYNDLGGWLEELHEGAANVMLAIVGVHVAGVLVSSWMHRDNLVGAMVTGRKWASPEDAVRSAWRSVAVLIVVAVLGFWWVQWSSSPAPAPADGTAASTHKGHHDRDDD